jgi:DNA-binding LacI/PurR family transcriptional regulator
MAALRHTSANATLRDVAARAGVSVASASRTISGTRRVRPELQERVLKAAKELGYRPHAGARGLRSSKTMTLGLVLADLSSPVELQLLQGIGAASQQHGYVLLVTDAQGSTEQYQSLVYNLYEHRIDGLFVGNPPDVDGAIDVYVASGTPALTLFTRDRTLRHLPLLTPREDEAIAAAAIRLVELGHTRFAYLSGALSQRSARARILGEALDQALGAPGRVDLFPVVDPADVNAAIAMLSAGAAATRPTVIFCNHAIVPDTMNALRERNLNVPEDMSLVSFSDSQWVQWLSPPISTLRTDATALGRLAANVMTDWLRGSPPPNVIAAESAEWVERASIGPAPRATTTRKTREPGARRSSRRAGRPRTRTPRQHRFLRRRSPENDFTMALEAIYFDFPE